MIFNPAVLIAPGQNEVCHQGQIVSSTESNITFQWKKSPNSDKYIITVKDLLTGKIITKNAQESKVTLTLLRGTPYSWSVESVFPQKDTLIISTTWKFYTSGEGKLNYAPFPADLKTPLFADLVTPINGKINLKWFGDDVDKDILNYDVYFGNDKDPALLKSEINDMFLNDIAVKSGIIYYWKVVTRDSAGNLSESQVSQFKVM